MESSTPSWAQLKAEEFAELLGSSRAHKVVFLQKLSKECEGELVLHVEINEG